MMELACETRSIEFFVGAALDDGGLKEDFVVVFGEDFELVDEPEDVVLSFILLEEVVDVEEALECGEGLVPSRLLER